MVVRSTLLGFLIWPKAPRYIGGGSRPYLGISRIWPKSPKIAENPYIAQSHIYVETTLGGGQTNPKEHLDNVFESSEHICTFWEKSIFGPHKYDFSKIRPQPDMGPGQIHEGHGWISILGGFEPPTLTLFGHIIIFSQFAIKKFLEKFLSG